MSNKTKTILGALVVLLAASHAPQTNALPQNGHEVTYFNGENCYEDEIGYDFRDCSGSHYSEGEVNGPNATWKMETVFSCQDGGGEQTILYKLECGIWMPEQCGRAQC